MNMNSGSFTYTSIAGFVALTLAITMSSTTIGNIQPAYAQPTFDTPSTPGSSSPTADDGENFQQFMECLFGGAASEEDISSALEGGSASTPTEQDIRDCFDPLYNTGSAAGSTTATGTGSGSTDETEDATGGAEGGDEDDDDDEGESSTNGGTSEDDEDESED
jgi:hypothetical protein